MKVTAFLFALMGSLLAANVAAESRAIEAFDANAWQRLRSEVGQPTVVVFSTTYCPNCPRAIAQLRASMQARRMQAALIVVVMDGAMDDKTQADMLRDRHYESADRLFVFQGDETALRYSVQPSWRGITPYVALLAPRTAPQFVSGAPDERVLDAWTKSIRP